MGGVIERFPVHFPIAGNDFVVVSISYIWNHIMIESELKNAVSATSVSTRLEKCRKRLKSSRWGKRATKQDGIANRLSGNIAADYGRTFVRNETDPDHLM